MRPVSAHTFDTIWGHEPPKRLIRRWLEHSRLPHAILLHGPDQVGKRSLAFAIAKLILSQGLYKKSPAITMRSPLARMVVSIPDLLRSSEDMFGGMGDLFGGEEEKPAPPAETVKKQVDTSPAPPEPEPVVEPVPPARKKTPAKKKMDVPEVAPSPIPEVARDAPQAKPGKRKKATVPEIPAAAAEPPPPVAIPRLAVNTASSQSAPAAPGPITLVPVDPRVDRLVTASHPVKYDSDDRPLMSGFVDLNIIESTKKSGTISVEQIRAFQDIAALAPIEGRYRIILIFGVDNITGQGANAILKWIEEPPSYLKLILVTDHYQRVLDTIRSRCAAIPCNPMQTDDLVKRLVAEEKIEPGLARIAATLSEGRVGRALEVAGGKLLEQRRTVFEARLGIDRVGPAALPLAAHRALEATGGLGPAALMLLSLARDRMVSQLAPSHDSLLVHHDMGALLNEVSLDPAQLYDEADRLLECLDLLDHPVVPAPSAPLELAMWPD